MADNECVVDICPKCGCINSKLVYYDEDELFTEDVCGWCNAKIEE